MTLEHSSVPAVASYYEVIGRQRYFEHYSGGSLQEGSMELLYLKAPKTSGAEKSI